MFHSEFYLFSEHGDVLEFRKKSSQLYLWFAIGLLLFVFSLMTAAMDTVVRLFIIGLGVMFLAYGIKPFFAKRKIVIDQHKEVVVLHQGVGRLSPPPLKIPFVHINKIEIRENSLGRSDAGLDSDAEGRDHISFDVIGKGIVKLDDSYSDAYTNEFTHKLSTAIGCKVVCIRY